MTFSFLSQGHAEDVVQRHRFLYYVIGKPELNDKEYDELESLVRSKWSVCLCGIGGTVGSDVRADYARYIQEGVRPLAGERMERDNLIAQRWLAYL